MELAVTPLPAERTAPPPTRLRGLETLRGLAAILVVALHAGIPYMTVPLSHLVWPARAALPSTSVNAIVWCLECFLMPLFYVLGGFFAMSLLVSRGAKEYLGERTRRLFPTQMVAGFTILPVCLVIWLLGWVADGLYVPQDLMLTGLPAELNDELWGVAHLWFLQNLYIYCLVLYGANRLVTYWRGSKPIVRFRPVRGFDRAMTSFWKPLLPAIPCALILYWDPRIVLGFYQVFLPVISKLAYYSIYFFTGCLMYRHGRTMHRYKHYGLIYLLAAGLAFAAALPMIQEHLATPLQGQRLAMLAVLLALFAWTATYGLLAVFLRLRQDAAPMRYLAEASFWLYLIHLPIVVLAQVALARMPIPAGGKYLLTGAAAVSLALLSYRLFVRDTWLGRFLNGGRRRDRQVPVLSPPAILEPLAVPLPAFVPRSSRDIQVPNAGIPVR